MTSFRSRRAAAAPRATHSRCTRVAKTALITLLLAVAGETGVLPLVREAAATELPLIVLPCAPTGDGTSILLARRVPIQTEGGPGEQVPFVPAWAGQWTPIAGSVPATSTSVITLAARLFAAQTGQPLPNTSSAVVRSDLSDDQVSQVVLVPMSEAQLERLAADAQQSLGSGGTRQGWLAEIQAVALADALVRIGPVPPPASGWAAYVVQQVYAGMPPGALDTTFPLLVSMVSTRSVEPATPFQQAFLGIGKACGGSPVPPPR